MLHYISTSLAAYGGSELMTLASLGIDSC